MEVFFHGSRVASHPRSATNRRDPVIQPEHMPTEHRKYLSYNADDFAVWAMSIGNSTAKVVEAFLSAGSEPECMGKTQEAKEAITQSVGLNSDNLFALGYEKQGFLF